MVAEACIQALDIDFTEGEIYEINSVQVSLKCVCAKDGHFWNFNKFRGCTLIYLSKSCELLFFLVSVCKLTLHFSTEFLFLSFLNI